MGTGNAADSVPQSSFDQDRIPARQPVACSQFFKRLLEMGLFAAFQHNRTKGLRSQGVCRSSSDGVEMTVGMIGVESGGGAEGGGATTTGLLAITVAVLNNPVVSKADGETADSVSIVAWMSSTWKVVSPIETMSPCNRI
jgi:hypothetical protein